MRISFRTLNRHAQLTIQRRYADLATLHQQMATGKRLLRPSDAPVDVANDLKLREKLVELAQYKRNIEDARGWMSVSDTAMMSMNELMQRLRELVIQSSSDTFTAKERRFIGKEVEQLSRQLIALVNTSYKGDYVFGGTQTTIEPFPVRASLASTPQDYADLKMAYYDASAGTDIAVPLLNAFDGSRMTDIIPGSFKLVSDDGSGNRREWIEGSDYTIDYLAGTITILSTGYNPAALAVDVSEGGQFSTGPLGYYTASGFNITFEYISRGRNIYGDTTTTAGDIQREVERGIVVPINVSGEELIQDPLTGQNLFDTLIRFGQSLIYDDRSGLNNSISALDASFSNILAAEAKMGARLNRFELTLDRSEEQVTETTRIQSELEDADMSETITDFSLAQTVYEAALKSAARVIQPSLVNFL
jgi:flagellar hook-associated protein 3 FlgL